MTLAEFEREYDALSARISDYEMDNLMLRKEIAINEIEIQKLKRERDQLRSNYALSESMYTGQRNLQGELIR